MHVSALFVCMPARQKRASEPSIDGSEPPCGCWELNSGPLEEQPVLLTAEPSLQPKDLFYVIRAFKDGILMGSAQRKLIQ